MSLEKALAGFMRYGSLAAVCLCALGMIFLIGEGGLPTQGGLHELSGVDYGLLMDSPGAAWVALAGLGALVLVSVGRLLLCAVWFLREGDRRFVVISLVTVLLVTAAAAFRLAS
ncbi:MAG: DUF1634 domain-containing protein [Deltaproteobacteria bacterium]|nr:DUF1634 domain-containing protein [Deltaproteobacteria bacterium]